MDHQDQIDALLSEDDYSFGQQLQNPSPSHIRALKNSQTSREMELMSGLDQDSSLRLCCQPFDSSLNTSTSQEVLAFLGGLHRSSARVSRKRNRRRCRAKVQSGINDVSGAGEAPLQEAPSRGHEDLTDLKECLRNPVERRAWHFDHDLFPSHEDDANKFTCKELRDEMEAFTIRSRCASVHSQEYPANDEYAQRYGSKRLFQGSSQGIASQRSQTYCEEEVAKGSKSDSKREKGLSESKLECRRSFGHPSAKHLRPANPLVERLSDSTHSYPTLSDGMSSYYESRRLQGKSRFAVGEATLRFRDHNYHVPYAEMGCLAERSFSASKSTKDDQSDFAEANAEANIVLSTGTKAAINKDTICVEKLKVPHKLAQALDNITRCIAESHGLGAVFLVIIDEKSNNIGVGECNRSSALQSVNTVLSMAHDQSECAMLASNPSKEGENSSLIGYPIVSLDELCRYTMASGRQCKPKEDPVQSTTSSYASFLPYHGKQSSTTGGNRSNSPRDMETDLNSRRLGSPVWYKPDFFCEAEAVGGASALKELVVPLAQLVGPLNGSGPEDYTHAKDMQSTMPPYRPASIRSHQYDVQYCKYDIALVVHMREGSAKKAAKEEKLFSLKDSVAGLLSQLQDLRYEDDSPVTIYPHHGCGLKQIAGRAASSTQPDSQVAKRTLSAQLSSRIVEPRDASAGPKAEFPSQDMEKGNIADEPQMAEDGNRDYDHLDRRVCKAGTLHHIEESSQTSTGCSPLLDSSETWQDGSAALRTSEGRARAERSHERVDDHQPSSDVHAAVQQARRQTSHRDEEISPTHDGEVISEEGNVQEQITATTINYFGQSHSSPVSDDVPLLFQQCDFSAPKTQPCDENESASRTGGEHCQSPAQTMGSCEVSILAQSEASLDTRANLHKLSNSTEGCIDRLSPLDELLDVLGPMLLDDPYLSNKDFEKFFPDEVQQRPSEPDAPSDDADTFARLNTLLGDLSQLFDDGIDDLSASTLTSQRARVYGAPAGHLLPWSSANSYVSMGQIHESAVSQSSRSASLDATEDWPQDGNSPLRPHHTLSSPLAPFSRTTLVQDPLFGFDLVN